MNIQNIPLDRIAVDPTQPRKQLNEESLQGLADSIRQHGVLNPITVTASGANRYTIVTGERRWRAAQTAKLQHIPCIVSEVAADERLTQQLIENLQREDLQPVEKARAIHYVKQALTLTNREVARRLGLSERQVGYSLDLLELPEEIGEAVISTPNRPAEGQLTEKHARFLKQLNEEPELQSAVVEKIKGDRLTGDQTGKLVKALRKKPERAEEMLQSPTDHLADFFADDPDPILAQEVASGAPTPSAHAQQIIGFLPSLSGISLNQKSAAEVRQIEDALTSLQMAVESLLKSCKERLGE